MKEIILDGNMLADPKTAHPYLKEMLDFPDYYGENLDALEDCLTDLDERMIRITKADSETDFLKKILKVFEMASKNGEVKIEFVSNNNEHKLKEAQQMLEFRYDTQLLIEGEDLDEDAINDYFCENFKGDCLLAVGDEELIKIHYHTNEPWKVLEYCSTLGEIYDIVVEDMDRQSRGLQG